VLGNVLTRANTNLIETFTYDNLNRATSATVTQSVAPVKTFAYDAIGNLLTKSDVGNYVYPLADLALPQWCISGGTVSTSFTRSQRQPDLGLASATRPTTNWRRSPKG
jgi:hypothetical protein